MNRQQRSARPLLASDQKKKCDDPCSKPPPLRTDPDCAGADAIEISDMEGLSTGTLQFSEDARMYAGRSTPNRFSSAGATSRVDSSRRCVSAGRCRSGE
jgi:hypothetical protein